MGEENDGKIGEENWGKRRGESGGKLRTYLHCRKLDNDGGKTGGKNMDKPVANYEVGDKNGGKLGGESGGRLGGEQEGVPRQGGVHHDCAALCKSTYYTTLAKRQDPFNVLTFPDRVVVVVVVLLQNWPVCTTIIVLERFLSSLLAFLASLAHLRGGAPRCGWVVYKTP